MIRMRRMDFIGYHRITFHSLTYALLNKNIQTVFMNQSDKSRVQPRLMSAPAGMKDLEPRIT